MLKQIFVIFDRKAGIYQSPLTANHLIEVQRSLEDAVTKPGTPFGTHTSDFELYKLGTFNPETGQTELEERPVHVLNLESLKQEQQS